MPFKALVVGLGQIGMGYDLSLDAEQIYSHARAFATHPDFELVGGVDPSAERRVTFARAYARPAYADIAAALAAQAPDVVALAVPTPYHRAALNEVLENGRPQAILCEKPLADETGAAQAIVAACAAKGIALYVNYIRRSDPGAIEVGRRIAAGLIEAPLKGVVWYSKGLRHNGSHFLNLLESWLGPVQKTAVIDPGRLLPDGDAEPDLDITFEGGRAVFLATREEDFSHYTIELVAANGRLRYEQGGALIEWQPTVSDSRLDGYTRLAETAETIASGMARYQWNVAAQLAAALRGEAAQLCSGDKALALLQTIADVCQRRPAPA
ncbi:Gfo/Idh/MocA family oxidoreductase [uncultured Propionivibrio sp.]|uniref:Gfo/Idh/MocA family protein n=1 Tax=uncultured Propionivibrio sp. TaxID=426737 RepID=UPI0029C0CA6A|nr:Gfo/Idh/MocA family oxidoreductase [uncultured Propionivibrio sp.]